MDYTNDLVLKGGFDRDQTLSVWGSYNRDINFDGFWLISIKMGMTI